MTSEEYEQWAEGQYAAIEASQVLRLAILDKYIHDPTFTARFIDSAASEAHYIPRAPRGQGKKRLDEAEFRLGAFEHFHKCHDEASKELFERLSKEIDEDKVLFFFDSMRKLWTDGKARQTDPDMLRIKASIRDHDAAIRAPHVFVRERVSSEIEPLFSPPEMAVVFQETSLVANRCMEDYLQSRSDWLEASINGVFLHRGIFPIKPIADQLHVELNYLSSYTLAPTVAEAFSQTQQRQPVGKVYPTIVSAPFPIFNNRIVAFAALIPGMDLDQVELVTAPPLDPLPLKFVGLFGGDDIEFAEYEFDELPPKARWTQTWPAGILLNV